MFIIMLFFLGFVVVGYAAFLIALSMVSRWELGESERFRPLITFFVALTVFLCIILLSIALLMAFRFLLAGSALP